MADTLLDWLVIGALVIFVAMILDILIYTASGVYKNVKEHINQRRSNQ